MEVADVVWRETLFDLVLPNRLKYAKQWRKLKDGILALTLTNFKPM
jgi:hypothetical protein